MANLSNTDAATLRDIIANNENWLIDRISLYARQQGYNRFAPTLHESWRLSIHELSAHMLATLEKGIDELELRPEADYTVGPLARFGIIEANRHMERGISLAMFLGLLKYYRQSYMDLIEKEAPDRKRCQQFCLVMKRIFDRIEIGLCTAWQTPHKDDRFVHLQQANRAMTNEKNKYLTIFESLHSPAAMLNCDNEIDISNHAWKVLFGVTMKPDSDYYSGRRPPPATWLTNEIDRFIANGRDEAVLEKQVTTEHGKRHLSIRIKRMLDVSDKFSGWVVILDDVTLQKQAEATLQETTILLTEMFNALEAAVFICTSDGLIVDANKAAQEIFGYTATELKSRTTELLHVDHAHFEAFITKSAKSLPARERTRIEYMAKRKNGDVFPVRATVTQLRREDHTPLGIVMILQDISAIKRAEEATRNSERLHGALELAGAVCHDLNQPLMAISGYAELILMDCPEDAPHFSKLEKIVNQVNKLGDITKKLMHVTRYETKTYMDQQIIDIEKASGGS